MGLTVWGLGYSYLRYFLAVGRVVPAPQSAVQDAHPAVVWGFYWYGRFLAWGLSAGAAAFYYQRRAPKSVPRVVGATDAVTTDATRKAGFRRWLRTWPTWIGYATAAWSLVYGALGLYWTLGGAGFPFGTENDPKAATESILGGARTGTLAPVVAALGLAGAMVASAMAGVRRSPNRSLLRGPPILFALGVSVALLLVIPDRRALVAVAYAPIFLVGAPFGWPPVDYFEVAVPWPVINQFVCIAGGFLWAGTAVVYRRRTRGACTNCGRDGSGGGWTEPSTAARWGGWAAGVAVLVPLLYAATRWAWALGIPLGISEEFLREGQKTGMWLAGAALSVVDVAGALLTLGLVRRWGEVFPRWMVGLSGRRVPPAMAIIPASLVSVMVTSAGLQVVRDFLANGFPADGWATTAPGLVWPLWGAGLGAATLAYYYRRRDRCEVCGRGKEPQRCLDGKGSYDDE